MMVTRDFDPAAYMKDSHLKLVSWQELLSRRFDRLEDLLCHGCTKPSQISIFKHDYLNQTSTGAGTTTLGSNSILVNDPDAAQRILPHQRCEGHDAGNYSPGKAAGIVSGISVVTDENFTHNHALKAQNLPLSHLLETGSSDSKSFQPQNSSSLLPVSVNDSASCGLIRSEALVSSRSEFDPDARKEILPIGVTVPSLKSCLPCDHQEGDNLSVRGAVVDHKSQLVGHEQQCSRTEIDEKEAEPMVGHCWTATTTQVDTQSGQKVICLEKSEFSRDTGDPKFEGSTDCAAAGVGSEHMTHSVGNFSVQDAKLESGTVTDSACSVEDVPFAWNRTHHNGPVIDSQSGFNGDSDCKGDSICCTGQRLQHSGSCIGEASVHCNDSPNPVTSYENCCSTVNSSTGVFSWSVSEVIGEKQIHLDHISSSVSSVTDPSQGAAPEIMVVADLAWITS